jgi:hypothetical protein
VSGRVLEDVQGKLDIVFEDAGEQQLKHLVRTVSVFRAAPFKATAPHHRSGIPVVLAIRFLVAATLRERGRSLTVLHRVLRQGVRALRRFRERASVTRPGPNKEGNMKPIITTAIVALTVAVAPIARAQQADDRTNWRSKPWWRNGPRRSTRETASPRHRSSRQMPSTSTSTAELPAPKWAN